VDYIHIPLNGNLFFSTGYFTICRNNPKSNIISYIQKIQGGFKMKLNGRVAIVTGAGSGIGAAAARRLAADGAKVVLNDISEGNLKDTAASLPGGEAVICAGDVTKIDDVKRMIDTALTLGGRLDILVNSAGIDPPDVEKDPEKALPTWHKIIDVDLMGPYLTMKLAIPQMIKNLGGSVINISSLTGLRYMAGKPAYTAAKAGLIGLTQEAAVEFGPLKIRCNVICPGAIRTPLFENNTRPAAQKMGKDSEELYTQFTSFSPMRRMGKPEEIAAICSFLASEDASFVTGNIIIADGGTALLDANGCAMRGFFKERPKLKLIVNAI
jgi:meso-butanediol dehydrogenase / (S,S)-butanediol dehydrogenase / diacetyl reductase